MWLCVHSLVNIESTFLKNRRNFGDQTWNASVTLLSSPLERSCIETEAYGSVSFSCESRSTSEKWTWICVSQFVSLKNAQIRWESKRMKNFIVLTQKLKGHDTECTVICAWISDTRQMHEKHTTWAPAKEPQLGQERKWRYLLTLVWALLMASPESFIIALQSENEMYPVKVMYAVRAFVAWPCLVWISVPNEPMFLNWATGSVWDIWSVDLAG